MECEKKDKITIIDSVKGIGIILVIAGHLFAIDSIACMWIFSFHMPLFFFISGYLQKFNRGLIDFVKRRIYTLLRPFVIFAMIGGIVSFAVVDWRNAMTYEVVMMCCYLGRLEFLHVGQIWFLLCLFEVEVVFYICYTFCKNRFKINGVLMLFGLIGIYMIGCNIKTVSKSFPYEFLPLTFDSACMAMFFFVLGVCTRKQEGIFKLCNILNVSKIITALFLFVSLCFVKLNGFVNISGVVFNDVKLYLLFSVLGIYACFGLGKVMKDSKVLGYIGRNSLIIFGIHSLPIYLYEYLLSSVLKYKVEHMYNITTRYALLGVLFVLVLSVILGTVLRNILRKYRVNM